MQGPLPLQPYGRSPMPQMEGVLYGTHGARGDAAGPGWRAGGGRG
jgi:hypothetical protein